MEKPGWKAILALENRTGYSRQLFASRPDSGTSEWTVGFSINALLRDEDLDGIMQDAETKGYTHITIFEIALDGTNSANLLRKIKRERLIKEKSLTRNELELLGAA